ncbi:hypothetical protein LXM63_04430 [Chryseobacterium gleum]|uniref:hypothetical protein n=1 Tax=Chryseobacterium gleum TaxID=250 RepID=UPI001E2CEE58|nr:hypothetical protein [Chryseobacterium gleum]MCE4064329.1 hypothetical protein [Chryseobacterium gleum]
MKQLEITTNKRLLIVEMTGELDTVNVFSWNNKHVEKICKGSDLTDDIAKGFTHSMNFGTDENPDIGYHHSIKDNYWCESALESFTSVIESKGFHWGENPVKEVKEEDYYFEEDHGEFGKERLWDGGAYQQDLKVWQESESRTFKPSKCIIFEIL